CKRLNPKVLEICVQHFTGETVSPSSLSVALDLLERIPFSRLGKYPVAADDRAPIAERPTTARRLRCVHLPDRRGPPCAFRRATDAHGKECPSAGLDLTGIPFSSLATSGGASHTRCSIHG